MRLRTTEASGRTMRAFLSVLALAVGPAAAYTSGVPTDRCGRPPEEKTCQGCHGMSPLAPNEENLRLVGVGPRFDSRPEFRHTFVRSMLTPMRVEHEDPGRRRWGFQLVAVDPATGGFQIGTLTVTDPLSTQIVTTAGGMQFVEHTFDGTCMNEEQCFDGTGGCPDRKAWEFLWTAPPSVRTVRFYYCSLAADSDCTADSDDRTRCGAVTAYPEPALQVGRYAASATGFAYQLSGALAPFNLWMHTRPDFDEPDGGVGAVLFEGLTDTFDDLPDCGGPACFYICE